MSANDASPILEESAAAPPMTLDRAREIVRLEHDYRRVQEMLDLLPSHAGARDRIAFRHIQPDIFEDSEFGPGVSRETFRMMLMMFRDEARRRLLELGV